MPGPASHDSMTMDDHDPLLERALQAYQTAWQLSLDKNQTRAMREAHEEERKRAEGVILELLD